MIDRTRIAFQFDTGITKEDFEAIVYKCAKKISRISNVTIRGPLVFCEVTSSSGISVWNFKIDFNDYGHLTGNWWCYFENSESSIPKRLADLISDEIVKFEPHYDYNKLERINLKYRKENNGHLTLRVDTIDGASYLWQRLKDGKDEWEDIKTTVNGQCTIHPSSTSVGNKYRCVVFYNNRPLYRSTVYKYEDKTNSTDEYSELNRIDLQYRIEEDGYLTLRVDSTENARYLWQRKKAGSSKWEELKTTNVSKCRVHTTSVSVGNKYRCIVIVNSKPLYRTSVYEYVETKTSHNSGNSSSTNHNNHRDTSSFSFFSGCDTWDQVKERYKNLMKTYHPDTSAGDEETTKLINAQFEIQKKRFGK